jgi:hypothetical protein
MTLKNMKNKNKITETEIGKKSDLELANLVKARPYSELLSKISNDWGRESDLYRTALKSFIGDKVDINGLINTLKNYDVYGDYTALLGLNELSLESTDNTQLTIKKKDLNDSNIQQSLSKLKNVNINVIDEEVQESPKLEYLYNFLDENNNPVVFILPINGEDKEFHLVWGKTNNDEKQLGVYNDGIVYPKDYFETNIVPQELIPANQNVSEISDKAQSYVSKKIGHLRGKEGYPEAQAAAIAYSMAREKGYKIPKTNESSLNLSEYKHYLVNEKTGKFRKFKEASDLAKANMSNDERYMTITEFKKFFETKVFGNKKRQLTELDGNFEMEKKLAIDLISKINEIPTLKTLLTKLFQNKNRLVKAEAIAGFAELIGVDKQNLPSIITTLKNSMAQGVKENKIISKNDLIKEINNKKVIKTVKIKDINND